MKTISKKSGFTLIELLVVVAIISLLSSIVFASLSSARVKARDARRLSDMKQINNAINLYFSKNGFYPICNDAGGNSLTLTINGTDCVSLALKGANIMSEVPIDPQNPTRIYQYYAASNGSDYALRNFSFEGTPIKQTGNYPGYAVGHMCYNPAYASCGWYQSCVYFTQSNAISCSNLTQVHGSR